MLDEEMEEMTKGTNARKILSATAAAAVVMSAAVAAALPAAAAAPAPAPAAATTPATASQSALPSQAWPAGTFTITNTTDTTWNLDFNGGGYQMHLTLPPTIQPGQTAQVRYTAGLKTYAGVSWVDGDDGADFQYAGKGGASGSGVYNFHIQGHGQPVASWMISSSYMTVSQKVPVGSKEILVVSRDTIPVPKQVIDAGVLPDDGDFKL
jgi:opacity protein-like surface antigen